MGILITGRRGCGMRNPSCFLGKLVTLCIFFLAVMAVDVLFCPQAALSRKKEPVKKDEVIDALITASIKGTAVENRRQKMLTLTISETGKIRNESKAMGLDQYLPEGMNANYNYTYREMDLDPPQGCLPLALEEQGSGSVKVESFKAGAPDNTGVFLLQVFKGPLGKTNMLQFTKRAGPETIAHLSKEPSSDNYTFMLAPVPMKITKKVRKKCSQYENDDKDTKRVFALRIPFSEITQGGMSGSHSWNTKKVPYKNLGMEVTNVRGNRTYEPKKEFGEVQYQVNWTFGKVKPEVQIYYITDAKPEPQDITNIKDPKNILVGQKVKLEARVIPGADQEQEGTWDFPKDRVIKAFKANNQKGEVILFEDKDKKNRRVEFFFISGTPSGVEEKISYTVTVRGEKIEGKTKFKVFKPVAKVQDKNWQMNATIGEWKYFDQNGNVTSVAPCRVTLGDQGKLPKGYATEPKQAKVAAGIYFEYAVTLPGPFSDQAHQLEYINLVKEKVVQCIDTQVYNIIDRRCTDNDDQWYSDKNYPYANLIGEGKLVFNDSPGSDLGPRTKSITEHRQYQTFLMFRPSKDNDDDKSVWVPLKLMNWEYKTAAEQIQSGQSSYCNNFKVTQHPQLNPIEHDWASTPKEYPQWRDNITNRPEDTPCGTCN